MRLPCVTPALRRCAYRAQPIHNSAIGQLKDPTSGFAKLFKIGEVLFLSCELVVPFGFCRDENRGRHVIELVTSDVDDESALLEPSVGPFTPSTRNVVELSETFRFEEFGEEARCIPAGTARKFIEGAGQESPVARLYRAPKGNAATSKFPQIQGLSLGGTSNAFVRSKMHCGCGRHKIFVDPRGGTDFRFLGITSITDRSETGAFHVTCSLLTAWHSHPAIVHRAEVLWLSRRFRVVTTESSALKINNKIRGFESPTVCDA